MNRLICTVAAVATVTSSAAFGAPIITYDASNLSDGPLANWVPSLNTTSINVQWNGGSTATVNSGPTNFGTINRWISTPDFNLNGSIDDSYGGKIGSGNDNMTYEMVFRPGTFDDTGVRTLFNTGGDGAGTAIVIEGSQLTFRFQDSPNANESVFAGVDLSQYGSADEFYHFVGLLDLQTGGGDPAVGTVYLNNILVSQVTSVGNVGNADGGDLAELGKGGNIPTGGLNDDPTGNFLGDIALFNVYQNELLTAGQVADQYNSIVPSPSAALVGLIGLAGLVSRRRRG